MDHLDTLTNLALVLAAAFLGGSLMRHLKQPLLVGYILVGVVVGPYGLAMIGSAENVTLLSELAILLLMFLVGLELDVKRLDRELHASVSITAVQTAVAVVAMLGLGLAFGWGWKESVVIGFALTISSTAVALSMLREMNEHNTARGRLATGILVAQDLAVIPMVLVVGAMGGGGFGWQSAINMVVAVGLLIGVIQAMRYPDVWVPRVRRWLAPFPWGKLQLTGQSTITALTVCFCAAALTGSLGLSAAYGAFLAGLVLGALARRAHYIGHVTPVFDVLMMVFFLSIGMLIDVPFVIENSGMVAAFLLMTVLLKPVETVGLLRRHGLRPRHALIVGASLGQLGEFSFVLAALGLSIGAIESDVYKTIVAVIALSLVASPLWLRAVRRARALQAQQIRARRRRQRSKVRARATRLAKRGKGAKAALT